MIATSLAWRPAMSMGIVDAMSYAHNPALEAARMTRDAKKRAEEIAKEGDNNGNQRDE